MTLGRKIILRNVALVLGVGLLAGSSLWGLLALRREVAELGAETGELNHLLMLGDELASAKTALIAGDLPRARDLLRVATDDARGYGLSDASRLKQMRADQPAYYKWDRNVRDVLSTIAARTQARIPDTAALGAAPSPPADPDLVNQLTKELDSGIKDAQRAVRECQGF